VSHFDVAPQPRCGEDGTPREGDTLLGSGQEHLHRHVLGYTITLGADDAVDLGDVYVR
jgi:hypothetical protein